MKCLTVRQPWAGLIALGEKDVENRTWMPSLARGERFAIHAGRLDDRHRIANLSWPDDELCRVRGLVIATVRLVDVVTNSESTWAEPGCFHWLLADPLLVRGAAAIRGRLGLFAWEWDG